jgi:hypothetical protein
LKKINTALGVLFTLQDILVSPIRYIYFHGPSRLGFWNGKDFQDACSEITRVPAEVWKIQHEACETLLNKDFRAFCIGVGLLLSTVALFKYSEVLMWRAILHKKHIEIKD